MKNIGKKNKPGPTIPTLGSGFEKRTWGNTVGIGHLGPGAKKGPAPDRVRIGEISRLDGSIRGEKKGCPCRPKRTGKNSTIAGKCAAKALGTWGKGGGVSYMRGN